MILLAIAISPAASDGSRIFLQIGNLTDILRQISVIGILSLAMTFVILTGGIDLSVGSTLALATSLVAMGLTRFWPASSYGVHLFYAIVLTLLVSAAVGALNGIAVAALDIQPFIVTLASMIGIRGLAKWLTQNANIDIGFGHDLAAEFAALFRQKGLGDRLIRRPGRDFLVSAGKNRFRAARTCHRGQRSGRALCGAAHPPRQDHRVCLVRIARGLCRVFFMRRKIIKEIQMPAWPMNWMPLHRS